MSEKRYFKIFSARHTIGSQNKYLVLFDLLDRAKNEDDGKFKTTLQKFKINADYLSADKNYLYHQMLQCLNHFHSDKTVNLELKNLLVSVEILFHKGLYDECLKLISRIELLAEACENFQLMIDALSWKKKCFGYSQGLKMAASVNSSINSYLAKANNLKMITDIYYEAYGLMLNNEKRSKKIILNKFNTLINKSGLNSEDRILSLYARVFYHLIWANYYHVYGDIQKELSWLKKLMAHVHASKTYAIENPLDYISVYNRLLNLEAQLPGSDFLKELATLKKFPDQIKLNKEAVSQRVFVHTCTNELEYHLYNNNYGGAIERAKEIEKKMTTLSMKIEPHHMIYFYYLMAIALVFEGSFKKALQYINGVLNNFNYDDRPQVFIRIEILNLVVHYELKNFSLVKNIARNIIIKDSGDKLLMPFETKLINALRAIAELKNPTIKNESGMLKPLIAEIERLKPGGHENNLMLSNYEKWLRTKIILR